MADSGEEIQILNTAESEGKRAFNAFFLLPKRVWAQIERLEFPRGNNAKGGSRGDFPSYGQMNQKKRLDLAQRHQRNQLIR